MAKIVISVFDDRRDVERAIDALKAGGYNPKDMSIIMKDIREAEAAAADTGTSVAGKTAAGAATGAALGGLAGLVAATVIPGVGAFMIGGPVAAALGLTGAAATAVSGAATGAVAGGLLGALTGFGLSENEARVYEERIQRGAVVLAVPVRDGEEGRVEQLLADHHAGDVKSVVAP